MELRQYFAVVWKWLWLIVLGSGIAAGSSYMASRNMPRIYQTSTTLMVGQVIQNPNPNTQDLFTSEQLAQTYAQMVTRRPVLQATVEALNLGTSWMALKGRVQASIIQGTQLMDIKVMDTDPQRAKLIADEVAQQLILQSPTTPDQEREEHRQFVSTQLTDLQAKIKAAQAQIAELDDSLATSFSARQIQDTRNQINALQAQVNTWQANYANLLLFLEGGTTNYLSVIEPAAVPSVPISPKIRQNVLLAGTVGLILALGAAFLLEYLDDTIKTPDDVAQTMGLSTLGAITRIVGQGYENKLITADHPRSLISEAFRALRTNIQFSAVDRPLKTLLVTSPNPVEGKSITIANLGVVMAQAGLSAIIVDSDLRRPVQHKIFKLPNNEGLTSALLQEEPDVDGHLQASGVENLQVLTSGPLPPNPSELLGSQKMKQLIEVLRNKADVVLFDSPPSMPVTDAAVLANQLDGVLIVADAGATRRDMARQAVENLKKIGANILGVALNRLSTRGASYYYYYYYYSRDGDGRERRKRKSRRGLLSRVLGRK